MHIHLNIIFMNPLNISDINFSEECWVCKAFIANLL